MSNPYASDPGAEFPKPGMHANPAPHGVLPYQALKPLYDAKGWLMLTAWFLIVIGVIYCITIIGLIIGWLPLWMGFLLKAASESLKSGFEQQDPMAIQQATRKLSTLATIFGVITIIYIVMIAVYLAFIILAIVASLMSATMQ